jgi:16S rRNA (uracil1498-N3)-methyltransferase
MRRFYAPPENIQNLIVVLDQDETRHIRDVLRARAGDHVNVFDGEGREYSCRIDSIQRRETILNIIGEAAPKSQESNLRMTLATAMLKGEKFDFVVQKSVELGVTEFVPLQTVRSELKFKDEQRRIERWRKIALEASKQCGRATLMKIRPPIRFAQFADEFCSGSENGQTCILFSEIGGERLDSVAAAGEIVCAIGPEGGWDDAEVACAAKQGFRIITLGGRILRAETAAITATALLQNQFGDLN